LRPDYPRRLGLSATYARADDGNTVWLDPYFGSTCFRMGYRQAIDDGVVARFSVELVAVAFGDWERAEYDELTEQMSVLRARLLSRAGVEPDSIAAFLTWIAQVARGDDDLAVAARQYLSAMQRRRRLLEDTPAKTAMLGALEPELRRSERALVFTQGIGPAERAAQSIRSLGLKGEAVHSGLTHPQRRSLLERFDRGEVKVLVAPQVLDEGIDVPAADLAVILAASRSRRQMVQRMGRVLRRKPDGRAARFVVVYVGGTVEDPAHGAHEGFLEEITTVADRIDRRSPAGMSIATDSLS
jgi:RNA polymerase primary sigma factor